ncbi:outer membrane protein assembly factor BamC [Pseudomonas sp. MYb185]|uniref:outer membrane protein assembly factor BamC n=1 Tax=Pseudomonas sp. MYb185 TaxID=1848729 RepID=UPI000CFDA0BD|nr:outer membrane protein assembly factor BamC [Pseudomonas sp. MYb185]PRB83855.1 hypothetical protein CQ007_03240 [Pseudomonas sp. MYb185]
MKPVLNALTLVVMSVGLSGCGYLFGEDGYFRDRGSDYQAAVVEPRMTVPAELNSKPIGDLLPVPGEIRTADASKYRVPRPQGLSVGGDFSEFSQQQNGSERWLLAQRTPASLWPQVRQFLSDYQVPVARESATLGEMETGWLAFDSDADNPLMRRLLTAVGSNRRTDGQEQRFRVRVEPGVQSGSSEVKVLHMQRAQGSDRAEWPTVSDNSNLERAVLAELETYLSQADGLDSAALSTVDEAPAARRSSLEQDGAGNPVLTLQTDFNRAWAAVGQALARADILVDDLNRSAGVYYVNPQQSASDSKPGFFGRLFGRGKQADNAQAQRTQIRLTPIGNRIQVTVEDSIDTSSDSSQARELLRRIHDNLN